MCGQGPVKCRVGHPDPERIAGSPCHVYGGESRVLACGTEISGARGVEALPVDVDRPASARIAMPHSPIWAEIVLREPSEGEHVPGLEWQGENAPAVDILLVLAWRMPFHCRDIGEQPAQIHATVTFSASRGCHRSDGHAATTRYDLSL